MRSLSALLVLLPVTALAQRVVILEIDGDKGGKLRTQVEQALIRAGTVEVVPLKKWSEAGAKKKLKSAQVMGPSGVAKLAPSLQVDAAVTGTLAAKFSVQILDSAGQELWTKDLKVTKGKLSADFANKLAKAIAAAARSAPTSSPTPTPTPPPATEATPEIENEHPEVTTAEPPPPRRRPVEPTGAVAEVDPGQSAEPGPPPVDHQDQDLEAEGKKKKLKVGPKYVLVWLSGTTTWRYYCARPGVSSCAEYDSGDLDPKPQGDIVDFKPQVPYAGFDVQVEGFPLAFLNNPLQGIGLVGSFGLGFSRTNVTVQSPAGTTPLKQVNSTDRTWSAQLAYRYYFSFDPTAKYAAVGYVGARGGMAGRVFEIDSTAGVPLPGANRLYGLVGLDVAIPIIRFLVVEASGSYFFNPKAGPDEIAGYGDPEDATGGATALGFSIEGGLSGELIGPIGYRIRFRYTPFTDHFYGRGNKWTYTDQGAAFESYTSLIWGLTASF